MPKSRRDDIYNFKACSLSQFIRNVSDFYKAIQFHFGEVILEDSLISLFKAFTNR